MRRARVFVGRELAAHLEEARPGGPYRLVYLADYAGPPVSLTAPVKDAPYAFEAFPAFLEGLLPEGAMLEGLLRSTKLDRTDLLGQLLAVGADLVGALRVVPAAGDTGEAM